MSDDTLRREHERLRAEHERLRVEHERLRQVLDLAPSYFYATTEDGEMLLANERMAEFWDRPLDRIVGHRIEDIDQVPGQAQRIMAVIRDAIRERRTYAAETSFFAVATSISAARHSMRSRSMPDPRRSLSSLMHSSRCL